MSQDRRRVDRRNPVKKAKKTGIESGISADDVAGCRGEGEVPPVEESVWTFPKFNNSQNPHTEALCCVTAVSRAFWADTSLCVDLFHAPLSEMILCVMPSLNISLNQIFREHVVICSPTQPLHFGV